MRIFDKALKPYSQNSELRGHCGTIAAPYRLSLAQTRSREISKKAAKDVSVKEQILLNLDHILHRPVRFVRLLRTQLARKTAPAARNL